MAAAVWPELNEGLVPLVLTSGKLDATWGDPQEWQEAVRTWADTSGLHSEIHRIAGNDVVRAWSGNGHSRLGAFVPPVLVPLAVRIRRRLRL